MPRMTPELLLSTASYLNPLKDRELDLRGLQIPAIENLGVTKDLIDSLDLTDNAIRSIINLPKLARLKHLYLSNNPVTFVSPTLFQSIPNLNSLVLTGCQLSNFNQLFQVLSQFKHLEFLVLLGNPVSKMSFYRDWCVHRCTKVRMLDYRRVKDQERKTSLELFYDPITKSPTDLAKSLTILDAISSQDNSQQADLGVRSSTVVAGQMGKTLTTEERERIKHAIEQAETVEEVRRLKRMLEQGFVPKGERVVEVPKPDEPVETQMEDVEKEKETLEVEVEVVGEETGMEIDQEVPSQPVVAVAKEEEEVPAPAPATKKPAKKGAKAGGKKGSKATTTSATTTKRKTRATIDADETAK